MCFLPRRFFTHTILSPLLLVAVLQFLVALNKTRQPIYGRSHVGKQQRWIDGKPTDGVVAGKRVEMTEDQQIGTSEMLGKKQKTYGRSVG